MEHTTGSAIRRLLVNRSGRTQIEVLAVLLLLLLLGVSAFSLTVAGTDSYKSMSSQRDGSSAVRIAMAYTEMKIHRYDTEGELSVETHPVTGKSALVIRETVEGVPYQTWIYYSGGKLREALIKADQKPTDDLSFEIVGLDSYELTPDALGKGVFVHLSKNDEKGNSNVLESHVAFRSGEVRP